MANYVTVRLTPGEAAAIDRYNQALEREDIAEFTDARDAAATAALAALSYAVAKESKAGPHK